jgi:hypothetical protein
LRELGQMEEAFYAYRKAVNNDPNLGSFSNLLREISISFKNVFRIFIEKVGKYFVTKN